MYVSCFSVLISVWDFHFSVAFPTVSDYSSACNQIFPGFPFAFPLTFPLRSAYFAAALIENSNYLATLWAAPGSPPSKLINGFPSDHRSPQSTPLRCRLSVFFRSLWPWKQAHTTHTIHTGTTPPSHTHACIWLQFVALSACSANTADAKGRVSCSGRGPGGFQESCKGPCT